MSQQPFLVPMTMKIVRVVPKKIEQRLYRTFCVGGGGGGVFFGTCNSNNDDSYNHYYCNAIGCSARTKITTTKTSVAYNSNNNNCIYVMKHQQQRRMMTTKTANNTTNSSRSSSSSICSSSITYASGVGSVVVDIEKQNATNLVDRLLQRTIELMTTTESTNDDTTTAATTTTTTATDSNTNSSMNHRKSHDQDGIHHNPYQFQKSYNNNNNNSSNNDNHNNNNSYHHHHHYHHHLHTVAFSGGVDSSLVAILLHRCIQHLNAISTTETATASSVVAPATNSYHPKQYHNNYHTVEAVLGVSPAVPTEQIELAQRIADSIPVSFRMVHTREGTDPMYIANAGMACYACKTHLYSTLDNISSDLLRHQHQQQQQFQSETINNNNNNINNIIPTVPTNSTTSLYNGTNADDTVDPTRVGLLAANKFHVKSPLLYITKEQVRIAAKHLHLPNWNYSSNPCLRSRLAINVTATKEHLHRIEQAERYVRTQLLSYYNNARTNHNNNNDTNTDNNTDDKYVFNESSNLRVRLLSNNRACIEIDTELYNEMVHHGMSSTDDDGRSDFGDRQMTIGDYTITTTTTNNNRNRNRNNNIQTPKLHTIIDKQYMIEQFHFSSVMVRPFRSGSVSTLASSTTGS